MMIKVQHWTAYFPMYGRDSNMGDTFCQLQAKQFSLEKMGVPITKEMFEQLMQRNTESAYPFFFPGTTEIDYDEAKFVHDRMASSGTTHRDLDSFRYNNTSFADDFGSNFSSDEYGTAGYIHANANTSTCLSDNTKRLHCQLETAEGSVREDALRYALTRTQKTDKRKSMIQVVDDVLNDPNHDLSDVDFFQKGVMEVRAKLRERREARLEEVVSEIRELEEQDEGGGRKNEYVPAIEWAAKTSRKGPQEKCMRNSLG